MQEGDSVHATMVMKISDERPALAVRRIETEPEFMHVRITPYKGPSATVGLYRVEVEISLPRRPRAIIWASRPESFA